MKKRFSFLVIMLMCMVTLFSGCALIERDEKAYLAQVVAETENVVITMEDLLIGYSNFGVDYVESQGMSVEEAIDQTIDDLINQEILINLSEEKYGELKTYEKNDVYNEVFDYINSELAELEAVIKVEQGLTDTVLGEAETEDAPDYDAEVVYEKKIYYDEVAGEFRVVETEEDDRSTEAAIDFDDFTQEINGSTEVAEKAMERYIRDLRNNEKAKGEEFENDTDADVLRREMERLFEIYEKNYYITKIQEGYEEAHAKAYVGDNSQEGNEGENILNNDLVERFINLVKDSKAKYYENESTYISAMQNDAANVYYHLSGQVVNVAHVLLSYSEEQTAEIEKLAADLEAGKISQGEYDAKMEMMADSVVAKARDDEGNEIGESMSANTILAEIQAVINAEKSMEEKAVAFNEFIYKYNQDPGMINASNYYAIPKYIDLEAGIEDTMVTAFADTSRELAYGQVSDLVATEYGVHIIISLGEPENFWGADSNIENITAKALYEAKIMLGTEKTYFDAMYDALYASDAAVYLDAIVNDEKAKNDITKYESVYKNLY